MYTTLAEGKLLTLGSIEEEADCRVRWKMKKKKNPIFQESQPLVATPSLAWVGRGGLGGSLTRYISPSLQHPACCSSSNVTGDDTCQCFPLLPMSTLQHCGKYLDSLTSLGSLSALNNEQPYPGPASPAVVAACRQNTSDPSISISQNTPVNTLDEPTAKIMSKSLTLFLSLRNKVIIQEVGCPDY